MPMVRFCPFTQRHAADRTAGVLMRPVWLLACTVMLSGCIPERIVWMPDSAGVIFTDKKGSRLVHYDIARQASRIVCDDTSTRTPWPGLRRDGKQIAVASLRYEDVPNSGKTAVHQQVVIYDLRGAVVHRSPVNTHLAQMEPNQRDEETALNWSGPPEKILLAHAIYDVGTKEWTTLSDVSPLPYSNQPISGDGKGFLATKGPDLVFVDWDGWISTFKDFTPELQKKLGDWIVDVQWKGGVATLTFQHGVIELDTVAMKLTVQDATLPHVNGGSVYFIHSFPKKGTVMTGVMTVNEQGQPGGCRLELQTADARKQKVLLNGSDVNFDVMFGCSPSPDGNFVAVRCSDSQGSRILIYDGSPKHVAEIACEN